MSKVRITIEIMVHVVLIVGMILGIYVFTHYMIEVEIAREIAGFDLLYDSESGKTLEDKMMELGVGERTSIGLFVERDEVKNKAYLEYVSWSLSNYKKLEELSYVVYMNEDEETIRTHALLTEDNQYYIEEELYNKSFLYCQDPNH
ncbi:MAG: hypothetical protein R3Y54_13760 [Eubacteriales bacterium]